MKPVLYIEDEPDDVFFLDRAWKQAGVANPLIVLKNAQQALDYLAGQGPYADRAQHPLPCLLLLDIKLPAKSGLEVLKWVRQNPGLNSLKAVILSASEHPAELALARSLGVSDYIVKPSLPTSLAEIVRDHKAAWLGTEE